MNKELTPLEALERLRTHILLLEERIGIDKTISNPYAEDCETVKSALKRLDVYEDYQIDLEQEDEVEKLLELNGKITYVDKVLDTQERLIRSVSSDEIRILSSVFKSQLAKLRKKLKALEIIKDKEVDVVFVKRYKTVDEYNNTMDYISKNGGGFTKHLTQEEYELLKETLFGKEEK